MVGVGHVLQGDDAAGSIAAHRLQASGSPNLLVIDAGAAPENFTGVLRRFELDLIVVIDAVQMNDEPGAVRLLSLNKAEVNSSTSHTLSVHLFATYLSAYLPCPVHLLGIQIEQNGFGAGLSPAVESSVRAIVHFFRTFQARSVI